MFEFNPDLADEDEEDLEGDVCDTHIRDGDEEEVSHSVSVRCLIG